MQLVMIRLVQLVMIRLVQLVMIRLHGMQLVMIRLHGMQLVMIRLHGMQLVMIRLHGMLSMQQNLAEKNLPEMLDMLDMMGYYKRGASVLCVSLSPHSVYCLVVIVYALNALQDW